VSRARRVPFGADRPYAFVNRWLAWRAADSIVDLWNRLCSSCATSTAGRWSAPGGVSGMRCRAGGRGACLPTAPRSMTSRRSFLRFLAGSPVLAAFPGCGFTDSPSAERRLLERLRLNPDGPVGSPGDALSVFDLEAAARAVLPPARFGYVQTGVDGDRTHRANAAAFDRYYLRPRRLVDVSRVDAGVRLPLTHVTRPTRHLRRPATRPPAKDIS
jgi:hypothetical protein